MEKYWLLNHICVAHLAATTICMGIFLTTQDCLFKLIYVYFKLAGHLDDDSSDKQNSALPSWITKSYAQMDDNKNTSSNSEKYFPHI